MWSSRRIVMYSHLASNQQQLPCLPGNFLPQATPSLSRGRHHHEHRQSTHGHDPGSDTTCGTIKNSKNAVGPGHHSSFGIKRKDDFAGGVHSMFRILSLCYWYGHVYRDGVSGSSISHSTVPLFDRGQMVRVLVKVYPRGSIGSSATLYGVAGWYFFVRAAGI